ncbi:MAG: DUF2281 domain-containing protein [Anaerolineae bacterium]
MTLTTDGTERRLLHLVKALPPERVAEVLDFAEFLYAREQPQVNDTHAALQDSFGVWRDRTDLIGDSGALVRAMRDEWQAREEHLGLG